MSILAARKAVQSFFNDKWASRTPIAWPDVPFNPPAGPYVRFSMSNITGGQASMGSPQSNIYRRRGIVSIQILTPEGKGGTDAARLADEVELIFVKEKLTGVTFTNVVARESGNVGDGRYQFVVTAEYRYEILN